MKTRKIALGLAAAMLLGSQTAAVAQGGIKPPVDTGDAPAHKVYICHVPGGEDTLITGTGNGCVNNRGGIILLVAKKAACNGHKIEDACEE